MILLSKDARVIQLAKHLAGDKWEKVLDQARIHSDPGNFGSDAIQFNRALADALEIFKCRNYPKSKKELEQEKICIRVETVTFEEVQAALAEVEATERKKDALKG